MKSNNTKVTLISHTPIPEQLIATAAKLCYAKSDATEVLHKNQEQDVSKFIKQLSEIGHESPFEHITFSFLLEGVSRSLLAQITRHRISSFSVRSQRYVEEKDVKYYTPPAISTDDELNAYYDDAMQQIWAQYSHMSDVLTSRYVSEGLDESTAKKKAIEDARYILPNACSTQLMVTMNARSLLNFFEHRCCNRAQLEIREVAELMLQLTKEVCPTLFFHAGAPCLKGKCPEGKMTCGKPKEKRVYE